MSKKTQKLAKDFLLWWESNAEQYFDHDAYSFKFVSIDYFLDSSNDKKRFLKHKLIVNELVKLTDSQSTNSSSENKKGEDRDKKLQLSKAKKEYLDNCPPYKGSSRILSLLLTQGLVKANGGQFFETTSKGYEFMHRPFWKGYEWIVAILLTGIVSFLSSVLTLIIKDCCF